MNLTQTPVDNKNKIKNIAESLFFFFVTMHKHVLNTFLVLFSLFVLFCAAHDKIQPLQPFYATLFEDSIPEPSGLTYCNGRLFVICDRKSCHYIYEIDEFGNLVCIIFFRKFLIY